VTVSDQLGHRQTQFSRNQALSTGRTTVTLPARGNLTDGLHLVDVIIRREGKVINWGAASVRIKREARISACHVAKRMHHTGDTLKAKVEFAGAERIDGARELKARFFDGYGRLLDASSTNLKPGIPRVAVSFPVRASLTTMGLIKCRLLKDGKAVAAAGRCEGRIPLGLNDAAGKWTLKATDVAGGMSTTATFVVRDSQAL